MPRVGSMLKLCCSRLISRLYRMRDSTRNRMAEIQWQKQPTTARANDQDRKLCSGSGIQSLSSPYIPNTMTAVVQNSAAHTGNKKHDSIIS